MIKSTYSKKIALFILVISIGFIGGCNSDRNTGVKSDLTAASASVDIISKFRTPDVDAKPMVRMWFPDAGAGADEEGLALVDKQINNLAKGGFGGVEIAFLSDSTNYTNDDAKTIGWGTENWRKILKQILKTANAVETGFKVDITITSHWPPIVNNIDPNDDEASMEVSFAYEKISSDDISTGVIDLPLPKQKRLDYYAPQGAGDEVKAPFLFVDKYINASIAKVVDVHDKGIPTLEFASLTDVSANTNKKTISGDEAAQGLYKEVDGVKYAGYAGGIPDRAYAESNGLDYEKEIIERFGPDPVNENFTGKIDSNGARRRMADWQYLYQTRLDSIDMLKSYKPSSGNKLAVGDYVIIGSYYRGTGQVMSGGNSITIYNRSYAVDYFSERGIGKVFEFWKNNILDDEMRVLLKENGRKNGTSIFEDSIEIHAESSMWTKDLLEEFRAYHGYDAPAAVLTLQLSGHEKFAKLLGGADQTSSKPSFDNTEIVSRIQEDYNLLMGHLYSQRHASVISKWASSFNYTYRAQGYVLTGLDIAGAAAALDIPEGDNSTSGDGIRNLVAAVNMKGSKMLSMESTTFSASITSDWKTVIKEFNRDFSHGVNRSILHGYPFARSFNRYNSEWPGWSFSRFAAWNSRQIYWDDIDTFSNYVTRNQSVMQNGKAKVDLAILLGTDTAFNIQSSNSMQTLLDNGYSYNLLSEALLEMKNAKVKNSVFYPSGPAYKALIIKEAKILSCDTVQKLVEYSKNGLPIILYNCDIKRGYGSDKTDNNDMLLKEKMAELISTDNVMNAGTQEEILGILEGLGIIPDASFNMSGLEVSHRADSIGDYYYYYNSGEKDIETTVSMSGKGSPYKLDAWTGDIIPLPEYSASNKRISTDIKLTPKEATIIAISTDIMQFNKMDDVHVTKTSGGKVVYDNENIVHRAENPGVYSVSLSDNTEKNIEIDEVTKVINLKDGWDLKLESWGPDPEVNDVDPTISAKKIISLKDVSLDIWEDMPATKDQLEKLGVKSMSNVSGIGYYSKTFTLPSDWCEDNGAYIHFDHNSDMVVEVTINDRKIDDINQLTDIVEAGHYLKAGTNALKIKLDSTLDHRLNIEKPDKRMMQGSAPGAPGAGSAPESPGGAGPSAGAPGGVEAARPKAQKYGLTGVTLIPYVQTIIAP